MTNTLLVRAASLFLYISLAAQAGAVDTDGDGIDDALDNCEYRINPGQENQDGDAFGDLCDADLDGGGVIDRAPSLDTPAQIPNTTRVALRWARGSGATGAAVPNVSSYGLERSDNGGAFVQIASGDYHLTNFVDDPAASGSYSYRVRSTTSDALVALSNVQVVQLVYPLLPLDEALDGRARLSWEDPWAPPSNGFSLAGYEVERFGTSWFDAHPGLLTERTFIDDDGYPTPADDSGPGSNRYRVRAVFENASGNKMKFGPWSNEEELEIGLMCDGQAIDPQIPALKVVLVDDRDSDLDYDGDDVADALAECAAVEYELLDGLGNDDGVCDPGEACITGGCILRALPETYDDVAIMNTNNTAFCDGVADLTEPTHCLDLEFPAGLVIEGHGRETVFRSPLWTTPYKPASIFEQHRKTTKLTVRNLVLDGRKDEQQEPGGPPNTWSHSGIYSWNQSSVLEILGDSLGDDDGACESEVCEEDPLGNHDGDGNCEAGEDCIEVSGDGNGICEKNWTNTDGCYSAIDANDGCIHNIESKNFFRHAVAVSDGRDWIIEQNSLHDIGCVNSGFGLDCPYMEESPEQPPSPWQTPGYGITIATHTYDFHLRDNDIARTTKYGIQLSGARTGCRGYPIGHQTYRNDLRELGHIGIFQTGITGSRVYDNTIDDTSLWDNQVPPATFDSFGMSLLGLCADDNQFYDNTITNMAATGILFSKTPERVACDGTGCTPIAPVGNLIRDNVIDGTCQEKPVAAGAPFWPFGAITIHRETEGPTTFRDNTVVNNGCRYPISAGFDAPHGYGGTPHAVFEGGVYEVGAGALTSAEDSFYCGAVQVWGADRHIVLRDDVTITNIGNPAVDKACVRIGGILVVDDVPTDPFGGSSFGPFHASGSTVVECSAQPTHPDCL